MKYLKKYESFVQKTSSLSAGDIIIYQGSKCEVIESDDFIIKVRSLHTGKEFLINQGQLDQYGIKIVEGKSQEENKKERLKRLKEEKRKKEPSKKVPFKKAPVRLPNW